MKLTLPRTVQDGATETNVSDAETPTIVRPVAYSTKLSVYVCAPRQITEPGLLPRAVTAAWIVA